MNLEELRQMVKPGESYRLEFKEKLARGSDYDKVVEDLCAFANHHGGTVLIGVADDRKIVGIPFQQKIEEVLSSKIFDSTDEPLTPIVEIIHIEKGRAVIALTLNGSPRNAHTFKGKPCLRIGSLTKPMPQQEYRKRLSARVPPSWETTLCPGATEEDIDFDAIKDYKMRYKAWNGRDLELSSHEILLTRGLAKEKDGLLIPTWGGIILFGKQPDRFYKMAYISVGFFGGTDTTDTILDSRDYYGRLIDIIDESEQYVIKNSKIMRKRAEGKVATTSIPQYPPWSVRELIVNGSVHRDYTEYGKRMMIFMLTDRVEFHSPGGFPQGVSEENFLTTCKTRNPVIARMLHDIGYVEAWGTGLNRVFKEVKEHPLKPKLPSVKETSGEVVVTLHSPKEFLAPEPVKPEEQELNNRQRKILQYLQKHAVINTTVCVEELGIPRRTAYRDLQVLIQRDLAVQEGKKRNRRYRLK